MQIDSCKSEGRWGVWGPLQQVVRGLCPFSTGMQTSFLRGLSNVSCTRHPCPPREDSAGTRGTPEPGDVSVAQGSSFAVVPIFLEIERGGGGRKLGWAP